jgi:hypothetical protein
MNMKKLILLSLIVCLSASAVDAAIVKGPYLIYRGTNTKMQVLWQLDVTQTCTLEWGLNTSYNSGSIQSTQYNSSHQHKYHISGLTPGTKYYYTIGSLQVASRTRVISGLPLPTALPMSKSLPMGTPAPIRAPKTQ